jgi:molybdenum cofactor biosynthesis enzyme MoaA
VSEQEDAVGQINIAGGEPFLLGHLESLIAEINQHKPLLQYSI